MMDDSEIARRFAETDGYIAEMDSRLRLIARQNIVTAGMVELIGSHITEMASRTEATQARIDASLARIDANLSALSAKFGDLSDFVNATAHVHTEEGKG